MDKLDKSVDKWIDTRIQITKNEMMDELNSKLDEMLHNKITTEVKEMDDQKQRSLNHFSICPNQIVLIHQTELNTTQA